MKNWDSRILKSECIINGFLINNSYFNFRNMTTNDKDQLEINVKEFPNDSSARFAMKHGRIFADKTIIEIGLRLLESVKVMDMIFAGMIANTYLSCSLVATLSLYTASSVIFRSIVLDLFLNSSGSFLIFCLSMSRLGRLTQSGHRLMREMKECAYLLERYKFMDQGIDMEEVDLLRQDLRYHAESPINPFAAFSLSTSTMLGTCGMIITYIIVLLQFKIAEPGVI